MPNTWLRDREYFVHTMSREGMALDDIRRVLRAAQKWRQGNASAYAVEGFRIIWSVNRTTTIGKVTGTAWYRVPTRN